MAHPWAGLELKRRLSQHEKASLLPVHAQGRALVMPGAPHTEIEELVARGFVQASIHGIDHDATAAEELYDYYWDTCPIHYGEIGNWLSQTKRPFSYIHYDFMGQFKETELHALQASLGKLEPVSRIRVSTLRSRRHDAQYDFEDLLRRQMLIRLLDACGQNDDQHRDIWAEAVAAIQADGADTTQLIAVILLLNHFFGVNAWEYSDGAVIDAQGDLPEAKGTHVISNISRYSYNEFGNAARMMTMWVDLIPISLSGPKHMPGVLDEMAKFARMVSMPLINYNPDHYQEP